MCTLEVFTMENIIEDQKAMIKYLQKRVQDHLSEKNDLIEHVEELENELREKSDKIKQLEEDVDIGYDMVQRRGRANQKLNEEVQELKNKRKENTEIVLQLEKRKETSDKVIKSLQNGKEIMTLDLEETKKQIIAKNEELEHNSESHDIEVKSLIQQINQIQLNNKEKEAMLEIMNKENSEIKEKLASLEKVNEDLKESVEDLKVDDEESRTLSDELGIFNPRSHNVSLECDSCDEGTEGIINFQGHKRINHEGQNIKQIFESKLKEIELEKKVSEQRFGLTLSLFKLKEKENSDRYKCRCKNYCRILHFKHNWKKPMTKELFEKNDALNPEHTS